MAGAEEASVPVWAAGLMKDLGEIKGLTSQIPDISKKLEEMRSDAIPKREYLELLSDVSELKDNDLGARSEWEEMKQRVPILWSVHEQAQGRKTALLAWRSIITLLVLVATLFVTLREAGLTIGFK